MENPVLVSICIPTYNRADCLKMSLESLVAQEEFKSGKVEIVISDNASTDSTEEVGKAFSSEYPGIHYHRNDKNITDANFPLVFSYGKGTLLKLCNDTLMYKENALKLFCDSVEKYVNDKPMLFFSNGNTCTDSEKEELNFEQFMLTASYWTTWIGAFSCWKSDFESMGPDTESASTHLWQVKQICRIMSMKNRAILLPDQFCTAQTVQKKDVSYGIYHVFYENYLSIVKQYTDTAICYEQLKKDILMKFFPRWIADWEMQNRKLAYSKTENLKEKIIEAYKNEPYFDEFRALYKKVLLKKRRDAMLDQVKSVLRKPYRAVFKHNGR